MYHCFHVGFYIKIEHKALKTSVNSCEIIASRVILSAWWSCDDVQTNKHLFCYTDLTNKEVGIKLTIKTEIVFHTWQQISNNSTIQPLLQAQVDHHPDEVQVEFERATARASDLEGQQMALESTMSSTHEACSVEGQYAVFCQEAPSIFQQLWAHTCLHSALVHISQNANHCTQN